MDSVKVNSVDAAAVRRAADNYAAHLLATDPAVEEIIVFGSFAEDTYAPGSDLDLFLILRDAEQSVRDRISRFYPEHFPVPIDLFPFTRSEMAALDPSPLLTAVRKSTWRYRREALEKRKAESLPAKLDDPESIRGGKGKLRS